MLMDASPMGPWPKNAKRNSRVVFIGRNLENRGFKKDLKVVNLNEYRFAN